MRVLFLVHSTIIGGVELSFLSMAKELKHYGVECFLVLPTGEKTEEFMAAS